MFTLKHLSNSFLDYTRVLVRNGQLSPGTLEWYQNQIKHLDRLGEFPADALRTHHLVEIKLTNAFVRVLKRLYKWAAIEDLVPKDPFAKLAIPPCGQRERVLTRPELARLYRATNRAFRRLLYVQISTLARPGEIRNLTWDQINWEQRVIVLTQFKGKTRRKDKLKARLIPLPRPVIRLLRNLQRKSADPSPAARVFISARGKPWTYNGVRSAMRRARMACGLDGGDEPVVCYHLRHTGATEMTRENINLKLVAEVMGHARTETTERYTHLDGGDAVAAIDQLNSRRRNRAV